MKTYLSVIIPCYNEKENLQRGVLLGVYRYLKEQKFSWEVIISDDGSTDGSLKLIKRFAKQHKGFRVLENKHGGKPWAVFKGTQVARGKIILFTDMDQSTPIDQLGKLLVWINKGYQVVIGSRGWRRQGAPFYRQLASWAFLHGRRLLVLHNIIDTQCGFKVFDAEVPKKIFPKLSVLNDINQASGWRVTAFDVELLFLAQKADFKIKEVPVVWQDEDISTGKGRSFIKESKQMLEQIINVRKNDWLGKY